MRTELRTKIIEVCDDKIAKKGSNVGLSFYAFLPIKMMILSSLWKPPIDGLWNIN